MPLDPLSLYIHIPFCKHKCIYCDFYSLPTVSLGKNYSTLRSQYLDALKTELLSYKKNLLIGREIKSIYLGGGTPSILETDEIKFILDSVRDICCVSSSAEVTIETNPGTADIGKLHGWLKTGVNRISIGIQSFNDDDLNFLSRIHNSDEASEIVTKAADAGFQNISIDLIFNLPGQSRDKWLSNLTKAADLPVHHISAYSLIVEENTELYRMVENNLVSIAGSEVDSDLYLETIRFLSKHDFVQYEVSNFAKKGFECVHNNSYWNYSDYLGLGCSSHSFINRCRSWNFRDIHNYLHAVKDTGKGTEGSELLTNAQQIEEYIMLRLRSGILDFSELINIFGVDIRSSLDNLVADFQKIGLIQPGNNRYTLTPKGFSLADEIVSRILAVIDLT